MFVNILKNFKESIFRSALVTIASFILVVGVIYAAWSDPASAPPGGNVDAPLNVGPSAQWKTAGIWLNRGGGALNGLLVEGNVGIGTLAPGAQLHVSNSLNSEIRITATGVAGADWGILPQTGNTTPVFRIIDRAKSIDRFAIDTNGNVGIGTVSPGAKLDVAGNVHATGDICTDAGGGKCLSNVPAQGADIVYECPVSIQGCFQNYDSCVGQLQRGPTCQYCVPNQGNFTANCTAVGRLVSP